MSNYIKTKNMGNSEWLERRREGIGASDSSAVLGVSKYKSPYQLQQEKITGETPEFSQAAKDRMYWGVPMENPIAVRFAEETGIQVFKDHKLRIHPDYDFIRCNLDRRLYSPEEDGPGVLEIKTSTKMAKKTWRGMDYSPDWFCQVQHQLLVTGWKWAYLAVLLMDTREYYHVKILRNQLFIDDLIRCYVVFWDHVKTGVPLDRTALDIPDIDATEGKVIATDDSELIIDLMAMEEKKAEVERLTQEINGIKNRTQLLMGDAEALTDAHGRKLATWKEYKSERFDSAKLKKSNPKLYSNFLKTKKVRRFKLEGDMYEKD